MEASYCFKLGFNLPNLTLFLGLLIKPLNNCDNYYLYLESSICLYIYSCGVSSFYIPNYPLKVEMIKCMFMKVIG